MALTTGQMAPEFNLETDAGEMLSLKNLRGEKIILFFYPKDDTPGCTKEACGFRDFWQELQKSKVRVIGISRDGKASHQKFKEKYELPFTLLSDISAKTHEDYGVLTEKEVDGKKQMGVIRTTFLIDEAGKIAHIWEKVQVDGHVSEVLARTT